MYAYKKRRLARREEPAKRCLSVRKRARGFVPEWACSRYGVRDVCTYERPRSHAIYGSWFIVSHSPPLPPRRMVAFNHRGQLARSQGMGRLGGNTGTAVNTSHAGARLRPGQGGSPQGSSSEDGSQPYWAVVKWTKNRPTAGCR